MYLRGSHQRIGKVRCIYCRRYSVPLFSVPHTLHFKIALSSPEDPSNRLPQSVQNTSDPIAAIAITCATVENYRPQAEYNSRTKRLEGKTFRV